MIDLSKLATPATALALFALVLSVVILLLVSPIWSLNKGYDEELFTIRKRINILQRSIAAGENNQQRLNQLLRTQVGKSHYLASASEALATAELQRIVKRVIVAAGGNVPSVQILPAREENAYQLASIRVSMTGTIETLVETAYRLETGSPYLFLDNVSVSARPVPRRRKLAADAEKFARTLDIRFELSGFYRGVP